MIEIARFKLDVARQIVRNCNYGMVAVLLMLLCCLSLSDVVYAAGALDEWREAVSQTRVLADNDAPRAYANAQDLQGRFPADATPADRALILNVLARIEIHLGQTDLAVSHAQLALKVATEAGDRVGQAQAELNIAINSVNQGKVNDLIAATTHSMTVVDGIDRPDLLGEVLLRTSMMYRRTGQLDDSVAMAMQAMEIAERSKDPWALTYAHQGLGILFQQSNRHTEAREHFSQMRDQARAAHSKLLEAYALMGLGATLSYLGDHPAAQASIREATVLFRQVGTPVGVALSLFSLAESFAKQGRHTEAVTLLDEVIAIYKRYPNKIALWFTLNARSSSLLLLGKRKPALADAERAYALAKDIDLSLYLSESALRVAAIFAANGNHKRAYELLFEAADLTLKATRDKTGTRMVELAQRYEAESRQREVRELAQRNQQQTAELKQRELQQGWLWTVLLGSFVAFIGTAFFLLRLRSSKNDLQKQTRILQSVLDSMGDGVCVADVQGKLLIVNPAAEKIIGIGLTADPPEAWSRRYGLYLPDKNTLYPAEDLPLVKAIRGESSDGVEIFILNPALTEGRWVSVTARPLLDKNGVAYGGVAVFSEVTVRKRAEQVLRDYGSQLTIAREEERKHIARELHDELSQLLSVLRLQLSALKLSFSAESPSVREQVNGMLALVDQVIKAVRDLVADLRPAVLDMGIGVALEWLVDEFMSHTGIVCRLHMHQERIQLNADQTLNVFRIVQESLTNIARHAHSSQVDIRFDHRLDDYLLSVHDNGIGFDRAIRKPKSFGLIGLQERALMLGGEADICSSAETGTIVTVTFPSLMLPANA